MGIVKKVTNWYRAEERAPITFKNIWAVIQSLFRRNYAVPKYIDEQIKYRRKMSRPKCVEENLCICGCQWDELIYADKSCEGNCYPEMMDEKEWKEYKKKLDKPKILPSTMKEKTEYITNPDGTTAMVPGRDMLNRNIFYND